MTYNPVTSDVIEKLIDIYGSDDVIVDKISHQLATAAQF